MNQNSFANFTGRENNRERENMTKKGFASAAAIMTVFLFLSGVAFASELEDVKRAIK